MDIILASKSPRRRGLFAIIAKDFISVEADIDESVYEDGDASSRAIATASAKCLAVSAVHPEDVVIGCDTIVELDGTIFGKPHDAKDAERMLRALSGRRHNVFTGVAIQLPGQPLDCFSSVTAVTFNDISDGEIADYISTGDPLDKAGAYGIQGMAARYINGISGDFFNVMGLPVSEIYRRMKTSGII